MHFLTDSERTQLKAQHRQERDGRVRDRIKAVLLYDKDWSPQEIAEALLISDQAVRNHNASHYRNKAVQQHLAASKITLHFLPPYSPNLNPIERLWKWMKEQVIYNTYYEHFEDFKGAVLGFFVLLSTVPAESIFGQCLRHRVRDKFRPIGAPQST